MSQEKYIGMDVHQATISVAVMDARGKLIMECLLETKETLNKLARLRGRKGSAMPIRTFGSLFALPPASGGSLVI